MKKLAILFVLLFCSPAFAGGYHAAFKGVVDPRDNSLTHASTVLEYCALRDGADDLVDISGPNRYEYSEDQTQAAWTKTRATVPSCSNIGPGGLPACIVHEDSTLNNTHYIGNPFTHVAGEVYSVRVFLKAINRHWFRFSQGGTTNVNIDLSTCTFGLIGGIFNESVQSVGNGWCELRFSWLEPTGGSIYNIFRVGEANNDSTFDGLDQDSYYISAPWISDSPYGVYHETEADEKINVDLADTNSPTNEFIGLQTINGNRIGSVGLVSGSSQCFTASSTNTGKVWDDDFTITVLLKIDVGSAAGYIFGKGAFQNNGGYVYYSTATNSYVTRLSKVGGVCDVTAAVTDIDDGLWKVLQITRRDDVVTNCVDGACGTPKSCSGYGVDGTSNFHIGSDAVCGSGFADESLAYVRMDAEALSPEELAEELALLQGVASNLNRQPAANVITDGDAELAGVASWTAGASADMSKVTANVHGGKQALRIAYGGTSHPSARQNILEIGKTYRVTGWARGDGGSVYPRITDALVVLWAGTTSTDWQPFDVTFVSDGVNFYLKSFATAAGWAEFDDIVVQEYDPTIADFARSTVAWITTSTGQLLEYAADQPRVGDDGGGIKIEGQATTMIQYSHDFSSWPTITRSTVPSCTSLDPEGGSRACILHEDATAAANHYVNTENISLTLGTDFVYSIYVKAGLRDWVYLQVYGGGVTSTYAYFNVTSGVVGTTDAGTTANITSVADGFYRLSISEAPAGTGTATAGIYISDADGSISFNGANQDSLYIYGAQVEENTFPTSMIDTGGSGPVTRTADDFTIDPHPEIGDQILPEKFEDSGVLTVQFDAKCAWSGSSDIGSTRRLFSISGNSGTASSTRNRAVVYVLGSSGALFGYVADDASTTHYSYTGGDPVSFDEWFSVKVRYDFSDMSRIQLWYKAAGDESWTAASNFGGNSGSADFDVTDTLIRVGHYYNGVGAEMSFCKHRNVRVEPNEF